ncbi:MAG: hypothetical protein J7J96_02310 [Sulfurimonas sp.]|nr:hypothetical protein [Sulfurimonas sp.]
MDVEMMYSIFGIVGLIMIVIFTFRSDVGKQIQTKEQKKDSIIAEYKKELYESLIVLIDDKQARLDKKSKLLKKFSDELSLNIFFDKNEIQDIILELAKDS